MKSYSWWNWGFTVPNIFLQISVRNLLASNISIIQKCSTRPFFPYWVDWEVFILSTTKKLQLLKQLVKLRKSSQVMILPDIRKCSKSDWTMVANRYSCFWSLGAIWQPLWLKNSHNVAIFSHFLTFSVTFLGAMTTFMHKTSAERTKTFLIHRTIDEVPFFAISRHLSRRPGVQKIAILWLN